MSKQTNDMPAFPGQYDHGNGVIERWSGMTLRDWFAGQALAGYLAMYAGDSTPMPRAEDAGIDCYEYADAILAARESKPDGA